MADGTAPVRGVRLVAPLVQDIAYLASRMRADERAQWEAVTGEEFDADCAARGLLAMTGPGFVLVDSNSRPFCAGGFERVRPMVWQTWMVGTDLGWALHWRSITRYSRRLMFALFEEGKANRIQTYALASRTAAHEWYRRGLQQQFEGTFARFFADGQDSVCFARTIDMHRRDHGQQQ